MSRAILLDRSGQQIKNLLTDPGPYGSSGWTQSWGTGGAGTNSFLTSSGPTGGRAFQAQVTTGTATGNKQFNIGPGLPTGRLSAGTLYTFSVWAKSNVSRSLAVKIDWQDATGTYVILSQSNPISITANTWTRYTVTARMPANTYRAQCYLVVATATVAGDTFIMANAMLTEGATIWEFADGNTPGWRWTGAIGASPSVGFPYSLPRLTGPISASFNTPNPSATASVTPNPHVNRLSPRTTLFMYEITAPTTTPQLVIVRHGGTIVGLSRYRIITTSTSSQLQLNAFGAYWNGSSGTDAAPNTTNLPLAAGAAGKHIFAVTWDGVLGPGSVLTWNADGTVGTLIFDSGTGFDDGGAMYGYYNASVSNSGSGYLFLDASTATRIAAVKWLASRYGVVLS